MESKVGVSEPWILALDAGGRPNRWLRWQAAVTLHVRGQVAWTAGEHELLVHGGYNRLSGQQTVVRLNTIVAVSGARPRDDLMRPPSLTNANLFARDRQHCMYCGNRHARGSLTRDHVVPRSRGGLDVWTNVVAACRRCNRLKDNRTPEEAGMALLAVPFAPNHAEGLILANRKVLADQMAFLSAFLPPERRPALE